MWIFSARPEKVGDIFKSWWAILSFVRVKNQNMHGFSFGFAFALPQGTSFSFRYPIHFYFITFRKIWNNFAEFYFCWTCIDFHFTIMMILGITWKTFSRSAIVTLSCVALDIHFIARWHNLRYCHIYKATVWKPIFVAISIIFCVCVIVCVYVSLC